MCNVPSAEGWAKLFPHAGAQMNTSQGTITSKLQRAIADQQDAPIRNTINWKVHGKVFQHNYTLIDKSISRS